MTAGKVEKALCCICERDGAEPYLKMSGYTFARCALCGLVYQSVRPVFSELRKRYDSNYFEYELENQNNFFNLMKLGLKDIEFDRLYEDSRREKTFLDIGCATGLLLDYMQKKGWRAKGVEVCSESASYAARKFGLDIFIGTLEEASFQESSFDAVHISHVIEHVPDPRALLLEIRRILKPGGHLVLTTPNIGGFQARFSRAGWRSAIQEHVYLFSKKTMRKLLELTRFRIVKQISWGGIPLGKRPPFIKKPADRLAKFFNAGDVMLFLCMPVKGN